MSSSFNLLFFFQKIQVASSSLIIRDFSGWSSNKSFLKTIFFPLKIHWSFWTIERRKTSQILSLKLNSKTGTIDMREYNLKRIAKSSNLSKRLQFRNYFLSIWAVKKYFHIISNRKLKNSIRTCVRDNVFQHVRSESLINFPN